MDFAKVLSVYELTRYVKARLETDPGLRDVWVQGEISNFKHHTSGHMYFTLKDDRAQVRCVMFRGANRRLRFAPENGMQIIARGQVSVYERDGQYQLYVQGMEPQGVGALHVAFEQLKARLEAEGLFDPARKRPLPLLPRRIGIVTSPTGAALRDMIRVARRRFPNLTLVVAPVLVQGDEAPPQIIQAIQRLNAHGSVDVIIVGRGGGSLEDLWAFNDEGVARAIASSAVPVVSAVGHETDHTIADFVADLRAPTPSAAAELVVPSRAELAAAVASLSVRLVGALRQRRRLGRERWRRIMASRVFRRPLDRVHQERQRLDDLVRRAHIAVVRHVERRRNRLGAAAGRLDALSPLSVLRRGYSIARRRSDGVVVKSVAAVAAGETLDLRVADGSIECRVAAVQPRPLPGVKEAGEDGRDGAGA